VCGAMVSWKHSLLGCNMASSVWALESKLVQHLHSNSEPNAKRCPFVMLGSLPHDQFISVTITVWAIWTARRKAIHEDIFQSPLLRYGFVNTYIQERQGIVVPSTRKTKRISVREMPLFGDFHIQPDSLPTCPLRPIIPRTLPPPRVLPRLLA
jgi:hypothetical protein